MTNNKKKQKVSETVSTSVSTSKIEVETIFTDQWDRLKRSVKASGDNELGAALEKSQSAISSAKTKKKIPTSWFVLASDLTGISVDWLVYGEGPMHRTRATQDTDQAQPQQRPPAPPVAEGELDYLRKENRELREENKELRQENRTLAQENKHLVDQNAELRIEVQKLKPDHDETYEADDMQRSA